MSAAPQNGHALAESLTGIPHAGHLRVTPTGGRRGSGRSRPQWQHTVAVASRGPWQYGHTRAGGVSTDGISATMIHPTTESRMPSRKPNPARCLAAPIARPTRPLKIEAMQIVKMNQLFSMREL